MKHLELVGILNLTPDSFSGDGVAYNVEAAEARANQLFGDGARYVDIGAESTRPGATPVSADEEWRRLEPVLQRVVAGRAESFSLDTRHPEIVRRVAAEIGPMIVNDVTGMTTPGMIDAVAESSLRAIVSHLPKRVHGDIQAAHQAKRKMTDPNEVADELLWTVDEMVARGVRRELITLDPGIGFGKTTQLNWQLLDFGDFVPDYPVMIGYSNKRFLRTDPRTGRQVLGPDANLNQANVMAGKRAIEHGAAILRVHDVRLHAPLAS